MIRTILFLALCSSIAGLRACCADEPRPANHSPTGAQDLVELPDGWRWDRAAPDHARRDGDAIALRTESGRIWAGDGNQNRIITRAPVGDAADVFARIELVDAVGKWEQCGLLVYQHDDSFVKLVVEHIDGKHFVVMAIEAEARRKVLAKIEIDHPSAELSLQVDRSKIRGVWRDDADQPWQLAAETTLGREQDRYFAVFSQDGDPKQPRQALVRGLRYSVREQHERVGREAR